MKSRTLRLGSEISIYVLNGQQSPAFDLREARMDREGNCPRDVHIGDGATMCLGLLLAPWPARIHMHARFPRIPTSLLSQASDLLQIL